MLLIEFLAQRQRILRRRARVPNQPVLLLRPLDQTRLALGGGKFPQRRQRRLAALRERQIRRANHGANGNSQYEKTFHSPTSKEYRTPHLHAPWPASAGEGWGEG